MNSHPLFLLLLNAKFRRAAPHVAGLLVKIFVWVLEMPVVGWILLYILKKDNLINKVHALVLNVFLCLSVAILILNSTRMCKMFVHL